MESTCLCLGEIWNNCKSNCDWLGKWDPLFDALFGAESKEFLLVWS